MNQNQSETKSQLDEVQKIRASRSGPSCQRTDLDPTASKDASSARGDKQVLTHSRMACFRACPRRHYMRYELGLIAEKESTPIKIGRAFHKILEITEAGGSVNFDDIGVEDPFDIAMLSAMFTGYLINYRHCKDEITAIASELEFDLPLINPDTGAPTPIWRLQGKIDKIVKLQDGRLALMEHKTTSHDFTPGAEYWQRLHLDSQLSIYITAARELGYETDTVLYDVTPSSMTGRYGRYRSWPRTSVWTYCWRCTTRGRWRAR